LKAGFLTINKKIYVDRLWVSFYPMPVLLKRGLQKSISAAIARRRKNKKKKKIKNFSLAIHLPIE
jgi:hypothetical protein